MRPARGVPGCRGARVRAVRRHAGPRPSEGHARVAPTAASANIPNLQLGGSRRTRPPRARPDTCSKARPLSTVLFFGSSLPPCLVPQVRLELAPRGGQVVLVERARCPRAGHAPAHSCVLRWRPAPERASKDRLGVVFQQCQHRVACRGPAQSNTRFSFPNTGGAPPCRDKDSLSSVSTI